MIKEKENEFMGLLSNKTNLTGQGLGKKMPAKKKPIKKPPKIAPVSIISIISINSLLLWCCRKDRHRHKHGQIPSV